MALFKDKLDERGQSMALAVMFMLVVLIVAALVVDFGFMVLERTRQSTSLEEAEQKCMIPSVSLELKNSADPGDVMCKEMVKAIRRTGFDGSIDVYFYEIPDPLVYLPDLEGERRIFVFGATLTGETPTIFASMAGVKVPETVTTKWVSAQSYSNEKVYPRQPGVWNGVYHVDAGADSGSRGVNVFGHEPSSLETEMPGLNDAIRTALKKAKTV